MNEKIKKLLNSSNHDDAYLGLVLALKHLDEQSFWWIINTSEFIKPRPNHVWKMDFKEPLFKFFVKIRGIKWKTNGDHFVPTWVPDESLIFLGYKHVEI